MLGCRHWPAWERRCQGCCKALTGILRFGFLAFHSCLQRRKHHSSSSKGEKKDKHKKHKKEKKQKKKHKKEKSRKKDKKRRSPSPASD